MEREHHFDGGYAVFDIHVTGEYRKQTLYSPAEYPEVTIEDEKWFDDDGSEIEPIEAEREEFLDHILEDLDEEEEEARADAMIDDYYDPPEEPWW